MRDIGEIMSIIDNEYKNNPDSAMRLLKIVISLLVDRIDELESSIKMIESVVRNIDDMRKEIEIMRESIRYNEERYKKIEKILIITPITALFSSGLLLFITYLSKQLFTG